MNTTDKHVSENREKIQRNINNNLRKKELKVETLTMKPNLTERQTNRVATRILADIQKNWWHYVDDALGNSYDVELSDQDFINISKTLSELLYDKN